MGRLVWLAALAATLVRADDIAWWPTSHRPDPFGEVVAADRGESRGKPKIAGLQAARAGYVSAQVVVSLDRPRPYHVEFRLDDPSGKLQIDVFREWFHFTDWAKAYYPDALVPIQHPYDSSLPEADNNIPKQSAQAFWVDVWVPADTPPGDYTLRAVLRTGSRGRRETRLKVKVTDLLTPPEDAVTIDHNAYGSTFLAEQYPRLAANYLDGNFFSSDDFFRLIHAYHRIFYEHRGTFHQLGYGHGGKVGPEFAPALEGHGRKRHVSSWDLFDRHYAQLLDGTAFKDTRRGAKPIPFMYLPVNPEWPACFVNWGEPGYKAEFTQVLGEIEEHFRQNNWVNTSLEVFFNHKKRYKAFPWDGDEIRFTEDFPFYQEFGQLLKAATPPDSPVKFLVRADVSWAMEQEMETLKGAVGMWVAAGSVLSWLPDAPAKAHQRGELLWHYSGPPPVTQPAVSAAKQPLRTWIWRADGYVHWLTVNPGSDPWFHFDGGGTTLVYPGDRFGLRDPIPSIRLKNQRNVLQDLALLQSLRINRAEVTVAFNDSQPGDWWSPRPERADRPPNEWNNPDLEAASRAADAQVENIDPDAWNRVRALIFEKK
ncbi:MAG: DUF4091 domain-containing protein [Bryobacteraceae bacterium]